MIRLDRDKQCFYQWDLNQRVIFADPSVTEAHFENGTYDYSLVVDVYEENGQYYANVPNILLQEHNPINVYAYCKCYTKIEKSFWVIERAKPADYIYTETEIKTFESIEAIANEALQEAEKAVAGSLAGASENCETLAPFAVAMGRDSVAGSKGYEYVDVSFVEDEAGTVHITLDEKSDLSDFNWKKGDYLALLTKGHSVFDLTFSSISGNTITAIGATQPILDNANSSEYVMWGILVNVSNRNASGCCAGDDTTAEYDVLGSGAYAFGHYNYAAGTDSFATGYSNCAGGAYSFVEGRYNKAGYGCHAEGRSNLAKGHYCHIEGSYNLADSNNSHAEGNSTKALEAYSHSEGFGTTAKGTAAHAEGKLTEASAQAAHAEGDSTKATKANAHAEGFKTQAIGTNAHAEGSKTISSGGNAHAEGSASEASGSASHSEGNITKASGKYSHAEGDQTEATANNAHSEGGQTLASGTNSHAEGYQTVAKGTNSHAQGRGTIASSANQMARGKFNIEDPDNRYADVVGNGADDEHRANMHTLDWEGTAWYAKDIVLGGKNQDDGISLMATIENIESALDSILAIQESLIGGNA